MEIPSDAEKPHKSNTHTEDEEKKRKEKKNTKTICEDSSSGRCFVNMLHVHSHASYALLDCAASH